MDKVEAIQEKINAVIESLPTPSQVRMAAAHIYGVAQWCAALGLRRGLDPVLCTVAGLLHDVYTYAAGTSAWHAHRGSEMARDIMAGTGLFTSQEIDRVAAAIFFHSDK